MRHASLLVVLLCCLGLAAPAPQPEYGHDVEITGAVEARIAGPDATARYGAHPSGEGTELRIELDDAEHDNCMLVLQVNIGGARPGGEEGTYELRDLLAGIEASRATIMCIDLEISAAKAKEGTLTITSSDETGISGELDYDAEAMVMGSAEPVAIHVAGTFTAEPIGL